MTTTGDQEWTPIGDHGAIGDLETLALVGPEGSIDWMCWPRFDSPSIFGRILDRDGGYWSIAPSGVANRARQMYLPNTNILITRFQDAEGVVEIEDFMAIGDRRCLVRKVSGIRGCVTMRSELVPRPDYGRTQPELSSDTRGVSIHLPQGDLLVSADTGLRIEQAAIMSEFQVDEGEVVMFGLGPDIGKTSAPPQSMFDETVAFWREWISQSRYRGRWREMVHRSALALKLLTHASTGGLLAAGTAALPEQIGGSRNWDYRYVWIRDAAFMLYAFMELGFISEAEAFTKWLQDRLDSRTEIEGPPLRPVYDLDGNHDLDETVLDHWSGYENSTPVRIGNAATDQLQLDIYGELIDSMYLANKHGKGISLDTWNDIARLADWVCAHWDQPDRGIWEVRDGSDRFVSSLLMCWVALERAMRMARQGGWPGDVDRWRASCDEIHALILDRGWNEELGAFTQTLDGDALDASLLLMPLVLFISPTDPKWLSTMDAIGEHLSHDALIDRYKSDDGLDGADGSFIACSFWYIEALARAGRVDEARLLFEKMLTYTGPLGLYSEAISPTGNQIGNYPQAFTHLSLISAAIHLDEMLDLERRP